MKLRLHNAQRIARVERAALLALMRHLAAQALAVDAYAGIAVVLTDDKRMAAVNASFLGHTGPTDVITFAFAPPPGTDGRTGEIHVNVQRALQEAQSRRVPAGRELAFYIAHGFDHLAGADDDTPARRARMHRREQGWLRRSRAAGLAIDTLVHPPVGLARAGRRK